MYHTDSSGRPLDSKACPECKMIILGSAESCSCGWRFVPTIIPLETYLLHKNDPKYAAECTQRIVNNAKSLLKATNSLLHELGIKEVIVSSGWRPLGYNISIGGATKSRHIKGLAVDLKDPKGDLALLIFKNLDKLKARGMAFEHPNWTPGWVHLQLGFPRSGRVMFIPNTQPPKRQLIA